MFLLKPALPGNFYLNYGVIMIRSIFCSIALSFIAFTTGATELSGKVKALYVDHNGRVLLNIDAGATQPNCIKALWQFNFMLSEPGGKERFSMLLASRANNTNIIVGYHDNPTGECGVVYLYYNN
jgi:hypothetical protein